MTTTVLDTKNGVVVNKRPNASSLVTTTVLNTKLGEAKNKILDHDKCISTLKFNKFDAKLKQANLATNHDLNAISQIANQNKKTQKNYKHIILVISLKNFFLEMIVFKICLFILQHLTP